MHKKYIVQPKLDTTKCRVAAMTSITPKRQYTLFNWDAKSFRMPIGEYTQHLNFQHKKRRSIID